MMDFRRASDRLNFFFSQYRWALLVDVPSDGSLDTHLQVLGTACKHWGSKLEFPFPLNAQAFANTQESTEYWLQKLPGLRLLHYRKQEILISDLFDGYDPQRANQLLRRKLQLEQNAWAHLIHFGGPKRTFICSFHTKPEPHALRDAIVYFNENHVADAIIESEAELSAEALAFGTQHGLSDLSTQSAQLILEANNSSSVARINRTLRYELDRIRLSHFHCTIEFLDMGVTVRLSPQCFALYCTYLKVTEGFTNKNRFQHKYIAVDNYRRITGLDKTDDGISAIHSCFEPREDKPLRDAVNKIKREIVRQVGSETWAKPYCVTGENGGIKRISINRDLVSYVDVDLR